MNSSRLTSHAFETARLLAVLFVVVLRFCLLPIYLQSYLNIAYDKVEDLKKEAGRITNVELQKKVSSIFYYLCVVTLQFAAPLILCLYLTLMYKSLGGLSWTGLFKDPLLEGQCSAEDHIVQAVSKVIEGSGDFSAVTPTEDPISADFNIMQSAQGLQESLTSLKNVSINFSRKLNAITSINYRSLPLTSTRGS